MENCDTPIYQAAELFCRTEIDHEKIVNASRQILEAVGEDPDRDGLKRTPERIAKMYHELLLRATALTRWNWSIMLCLMWLMMKWSSFAILNFTACVNTTPCHLLGVLMLLIFPTAK